MIEQKETLRPMMKISEMVDYLKQKNIKFEKMAEKEAEKYLRDNIDVLSRTTFRYALEKMPNVESHPGSIVPY